LRRGMNRPAAKDSGSSHAALEATPFMPMPMVRTIATSRRPRQLQTSHS
jgi:hypothetical protein